MVRYGAHVHSTYPADTYLWSVLEAAAEAGFDGVDVADHCHVSTREGPGRRSSR